MKNYGDLKRQMQLQEDFVSTISHELRTPLGFIKGYSTSLLRQDTSWDDETQKEFLTIIDEEADRLSLLIENVLELARLQSKTFPLRFQPIRLDAVLRDVIMRIRSRQKELDVSMELETSLPFLGMACGWRRSSKTFLPMRSNMHLARHWLSY